MTTENQIAVLAPADRAALALKSSTVETELLALAKSSADIIAVIDGAGRDQAHRIAMVLRGRRTDITKTGKEARDDATKFGKAVIAEEARLIALIEPEETRVLALRDGYDAEQARIEAERVAKERKRMEAHEAGIMAIYKIPADCASKNAADVLACEASCAHTVCGEEWEEYQQRANAAYSEVQVQLRDMYVAKLGEEEAARAAEEARETERKRIAAEAEALAIQKAEQEAEAKRLAEQQAEQQRVAAETKRQLEAQQEAINEQRRVAEAEQKRQADDLAAQRAAFEAEQRAAQEAKEAAAKLEADHAEALVEDLARTQYKSNQMEDAAREHITGTMNTKSLEEAAQADEQRSAPTLRLGMISDRLNLNITAAMMLDLGFTPSGKDKAAVLFHEHEFPNICVALVARINAAKMAWSLS